MKNFCARVIVIALVLFAIVSCTVNVSQCVAYDTANHSEETRRVVIPSQPRVNPAREDIKRVYHDVQIWSTDKQGNYKKLGIIKSVLPKELRFLELISELWENGQIFRAKDEAERDTIVRFCREANIYVHWDELELCIGHNWW